MQQELISLIIPCYNCGKTLAGTLNSVREQEYSNLEIILVNDGSVDNTLEIANSYAAIDNRIHVYSQENQGVSVARNTGLSHATADYIVFLDADDNYTTPHSLMNMMKRLKETDADMCVCSFTHPCFETYLETGIYDLTDDRQFLEFFQDFFSYGMPWNKITKKKCLTESFVRGVKFNEDELFNLDNLKNIKKVALINEVYHNYYCAPYNPNVPASAVNSIYSVDKFWEKKSTIWHMGMKNHEYRVKSIAKNFPEKFVDMQYVRSFDFFFWDFFLMAKNRVPEEYILQACHSIFEQQLFKDSLKDKERYGLRLRNYTCAEISSFVHYAYYSFMDIKYYNKTLSMYKVFLALFNHFFYDATENLNDVDIVAKVCKDAIEAKTPETHYVNSLLNRKDIEVREDDCNIILFNKIMNKWKSMVEVESN